jgi:transmembrane sensor
LTEQGVESCDAFEAWLAADPEHRAAWTDTQAAWALVDDFATSPEMIKARRDALAGIGRRSPNRWPLARAWAAAALVVAVGCGAAAWHSTRPLDFRTALDERRVVALSDGSTVSLDSRSEVKIRFSRHARRLELVSGQARFDVAHDASRPFSVTADNRTIIATGTAFNVDIVDNSLAVAMIEGRVVVVDAGQPNVLSPVRPPAATPLHKDVLVAGEQLTVGANGRDIVAKGNLEQTMAWQEGQLVFDNQPIKAVAERVSWYADRPIRVAPDIGDLRVSGVFKIGDTKTFVDAVTNFLPVSAAAGRDGGAVLYRRR